MVLPHWSQVMLKVVPLANATCIWPHSSSITWALYAGAAVYKHIHCAQKWRLVTNLFTFPIFMFSYIPITVAALFLKVDWVPTQHAVNVTLDEVMQGAK